MDYLEYIKTKFSYMREEDIEYFANIAKETLANTLSPSPLKPIEMEKYIVPSNRQGWVARAVIEMIEREGISSAAAYSENGLSITFDRPQVSQALISELTSDVGIIKYVGRR